MHRSASPRNRPPQAVSLVRHGFLHVDNVIHVERWMRRDRFKPLVPALVPEEAESPREESKTDVHEIVPLVETKQVRKDSEPSKQEMKVLLSQSLAAYSGLLKLRVLNQFARTVLGADGLEDLLIQMTKNQLHRASRYLPRKGKPRKLSGPKTFERVWREQLAALVNHARRFVDEAKQTNQTTRRGYFILRGVSLKGRPVFITLHNRDNVVVGIYSGKQFNQKRANRSRRVESHQQAAAYRKSKARLSPR